MYNSRNNQWFDQKMGEESAMMNLSTIRSIMSPNLDYSNMDSTNGNNYLIIYLFLFIFFSGILWYIKHKDT